MSAHLWEAPKANGPLNATVNVPGSKSLMNRALVLAALANGPSTIANPLYARDTELMIAALNALGARVTDAGGELRVMPIDPSGPADIDCGLAGTVMRFIPPVAALLPHTYSFDGDPRARERPMAETIASLRDLGIEVADDGRGALPFSVTGKQQVRGGRLNVDASASSQFVSSLLLVGAKFTDGLDLHHTGTGLPSRPHIDMTVSELRRRGVNVTVEQNRWLVSPGPVEALDVTIEPDLSNAGPFIAAALVTGGTIRVANWPQTTDQAGDAWRNLVTEFGGSFQQDGTTGVFSGPATLRAVDLDLHDVGELTPVTAAVAALAPGRSRLRGVGHLRGHETDRLAALETELTKLGASVEQLDDGLVIESDALRAATFATYDDHRMAHAAAVLGLRVPGLLVENIETTSKTYPRFAEDWLEMARA